MGSIAIYKVSRGLKWETLDTSACLVSRTDLNEITTNNTNFIFRIKLHLRENAHVNSSHWVTKDLRLAIPIWTILHKTTQNTSAQYDVWQNCAVSWILFSLNFSRLIYFFIVIVCCQRFIRYEQQNIDIRHFGKLRLEKRIPLIQDKKR